MGTALMSAAPFRFELNQRSYPVMLRRKPAGLPEQLERLKRQLIQKAPFRQASKLEMFKHYADTGQYFQKLYGQIDRYLTEVSIARILPTNRYQLCSLCNTAARDNDLLMHHDSQGYYRCPECGQYSQKERWRLCQGDGSAFQTFPLPAFVAPKAFGVEIAAGKSAEQMHTEMAKEVEATADGIVSNLADTADLMVENKHAGLFIEIGEGMGRYHYYTYADDVSVTDRRGPLQLSIDAARCATRRRVRLFPGAAPLGPLGWSLRTCLTWTP